MKIALKNGKINSLPFLSCYKVGNVGQPMRYAGSFFLV